VIADANLGEVARGCYATEVEVWPHAWSVVDDTLVIESASGRRVEFAQATVEIFNCALPAP